MKPIFSRNNDFEKIAFLNWRINSEEIRNLFVMADGFLRSSIALAKACLIDNTHKEADIFIFPILNNANHGIELYLKSMMWTLNELLESGRRIEGGHNINQLFEIVRSKLRVYQGNITLTEFDEETVNLKEYLDELFLKIQATPKENKMDFSRYPINSNYENHFYVDEIGNIEIDLENFVERFTKIHDTLDHLSSYLYYQELRQEW